MSPAVQPRAGASNVCEEEESVEEFRWMDNKRLVMYTQWNSIQV